MPTAQPTTKPSPSMSATSTKRPAAQDDTATTAENAAISVDVLANDTDLDAADGLALTAVTLAGGAGTAAIVGGEVQFDPGSSYDHLAAGETATVLIDYTVEDDAGASDTGRLTLTVTGSNDGPTVTAPIADQAATEDTAFSYQVPEGTFDDLDAADTLSYTATLADGSLLPAWLSFDPASRTFSGTPDNGDVADISVSVTATDDHGASVTDTFEIATANTNDAPDDLALSSTAVDENAASGTVVGTATASDADSGESLTYALTDDAGGRFAINSTTGQITVANGADLDHEAADTHDVTVQVTDADGATYDETFTINVGDVNEGPAAQDDTAATAENAAISVDVLANDTDLDAADGLALTAVTLAGGAGTAAIVGGEVQFDPGSSYDHLAAGETATVLIDYTVEDDAGASDTGRLTLTVTGSNDGPTVTAPIADQAATEDTAFSYQVPEGTFDDLDAADTLSYTATLADGSPLPAWLSFDPASRTFSGTPDNGDVADISVSVTATDDHGASVTDTFEIATANTNDAPDDLALSSAAVDENAASGTVVGTATASDADGGESLTYALTDDAGGRFAINTTTGQITVANGADLDHEAADTHDVTIRVTDADGATYDETFTINVGDVNEAPAAQDDTATTAENAAISVDVLANDTDLDAADGLALTAVTLAGGAGTAAIVGGEVQFDPGSSYDHLAAGETATVLIDYTVEDDAGASDTGRLTLTVTGSNDGPTVTAPIADQAATEDTAFSYQVPEGTFDDLDAADTLSYTATLADGSPLPAWLSFDPASRTFSGTPDNGDVADISVSVTATDDQGASVTDTFEIATANTNDAPDDLALSSATVDENAASGTVVGTATASDADSGESLTYALTDDAGGRFAINSTTGQITVANGADLDHEAADTHDVTVRVTDADGATYDETFTINVGDVNEGPAAQDDTAATAENAAISVDVLANDTDLDAADGLALTAVTLAGGAGTAAIVGGEVQFDPGSSYDHLAVGETATVLIDYTVEDDAGASDTGRLTLTVTGSNDGPTVTAPIADQAATEDTAFSYQVPEGTFDDLDAADTLSYTATLADGSPLPAWLSFDPASRTFSGTPDNGDVADISVSVTATDDHGASVTDTFEIATANTNDAPDDLALSSTAVDENAASGTVVGTATASDADSGESLTYALTDDAGGRFAINSTTGQITVANGADLDHEAADTHDVTVQVTDADGATYDETFTINVGDVNEGPAAQDDTAATAENAAISVDVLANDTDLDAADGLALTAVTLAGGAGTAAIVGGEVQFDPGSSYDHLAAGETATVLIDYTVEDDAGASDTGRLTLTVTGSNDGPTVTAPIADQAATEDTAFSYQVPEGTFDDLDAADTLSYTATLADGSPLPAWLSFDPASRTFSGTPDNGDVADISVSVTATDDHGASVTDTFEIATANTNDAPDDLALSSTAVDENAASGTVVGTATASDADSGESLTYALTDDAGGRFAINSTTGQITVANGADLDHEAADTHDVTVQVTDADGATYDETFTINVGDVNEGPAAQDDTAATAENAAISVDVLANDTDLDAADGLALTAVTLAGGAGTAAIVGGEVQFDPGSSYDHLAAGETATVLIDYTVEDDAGASDTGRLTLTVTGSNDGPTVTAPIADQAATEDTAFSYQVPEGTFDDLDAADTLSYTATLADGSPLPAWLSFDPASRTFSGTPDNGDVADISVSVTATDDHGASVTDTFEIATANTNDAPDDLALSSAAVDENAASGTVVGTATASDADGGESLTYALTDDAGGRFAINTTTGQITVANGADLDHEAADTHDVTIRVTDADGATYDETFTINVGDVNEGPDDLSLTGVARTNSTTVVSEDFESGASGWSDNETSAGGTGLDGNYLGNFGDTGGAQTIYKTFSLSGDQDSVTINFDFWEFDTWNGEDFKIWVDDQLISTDTYFTQQYYGSSDSSTYGTSTSGTTSNLGEGRYNDQTHSYSFNVNSSASTIKLGFGASLDESLANNTESWGIDNVQIVEHGTGSSTDVQENSANGTVVGTAAGADPDAGETLSYSLTDSADGRFAIDGTTGEITVADGSLLDYESATSHDLTVRVTDAGGASYDETFTIDVVDVEENAAPTDLTISSPSETIAATSETVATGEIVSTARNYASVDRWSIDHDGGDLEIDVYAEGFNGSGLDSIIYLYRDNGGGSYSLVANNDDGARGDDGSTSQYDSYLNLSDLSAGNYILAVGGYGTSSREAIASGSNDDAWSQETGAYQITLTGSTTLNGIATDPTDGGQWGDPTGAASITSHPANGGIDADTVIASVQTVDTDSRDTASYSLVDDDGGRYSIDSSGDVRLEVGHDGSSVVNDEITIRTTDSGGESYEEIVDISLGSTGDETLTGGAGSDVLHGLSGSDTLNGGAGDDALLGGDGADLFILLQGQGNDTISGGAGGDWTDTIELQDGSGGNAIGTYGSDWTVQFDSGSVESTGSDAQNSWLDLTDDAAGTITMQDGTEIDFSGIEHIQW